MPRAEREQLILDIAGQVFARDGYHSASMDEIARQAGVSKPMLYAYFESKEGLYVAYIERTGQELIERLQSTFSAASTPARRMRGGVGEFLAFVEQYRDGWKVLFNEASANRPVAEQVAELRRRVAAAVRRLVEDGLSGQTDVAPSTADAVAHAIVGAGESLANWWLGHPDVSCEQVAEWYAAVIRGTVAGVTSPRPRRA